MVCVALSALLLGSGAQLPEPGKDWIVAGEYAYGLLPPQYVAGPSVEEVSWSPSGRYALVLCRPTALTPDRVDYLIRNGGKEEQEELILYLWSSKSLRATKMWSGKGKHVDVSSPEWLTGSECAIFQTDAYQEEDGPSLTKLLRLDCSTSKVTELASGDIAFDFSSSPIQPFAIVTIIRAIDEDAFLFTNHICNTTGGLSAAIIVPSSMKKPASWWDESGKPFFASVEYVKQADGKTKRAVTYASLDLATRKVTIQDIPPKPYRSADVQYAIEAFQLDDPIKIGATRIRPVFIQGRGGNASVFVTADAEDYDVSPACDGVYFVKDGLCFIRPIWKIPKSLYETMLVQAARTKIMSDVSQIGKAFIMYAGDNDDKLPGKGEDIANLLGDYVMDDKLLDGFQYTCSGGLMTNIADPASTQLGFKLTPDGGRAVLYADGHVRWMKN